MNGKITKRLPWAMMTLLLTACSEFLPEQKFSCSKGHRATVQLNVSTASETEVSGTRGEAIEPGSVREGTEDNYKVSDFWLLEYGADGRLVEADGKPAMQYVTRDDLEKKNHRLDIQLPNGNSDKYRCVMIANTHDENFFNGRNVSSYETIDKLVGFTKEVKSLGEDTYNNDGGKGELYLNCVKEVSNTSKTLECKFYRNVAKLTVNVINDSESEMKITGIQICNVPNRMAYADQLYKRENNIRDENAKMADGATVIDTPREDILLEVGKNIERVYYLPRNCQGVDEDRGGVNEDQKNKSRKSASATCVKVFATDTTLNIPYCYTFYIGKDMKNDFNVEPNNHYKLSIDIKNHGSDTDSRIEDMGTIGANCIMMDLYGKKNKVYTIYPYRRINKFWGEVNGNINKTITNNSRWTAEIIWQDIPDDVISFDDWGAETFEGKGKQPLKIKLKNPSSPCNVLIGVREREVSEEYLWSWHLWITPYKPEECKELWKDGKYEYGVTYGSVFRYAPGMEGSQDNDLWTIGGEYYNKYIMDRNLGATTYKTPTLDQDIKETSGMGYQFGRKDPFLIAKDGPLYKQYLPRTRFDCSKVIIAYMVADDYSSAVICPYAFYNIGYEKTNWTKATTYNNNDWNNPFPKEEKFKNKSFFDPCPEGWRVPKKGTWNAFKTKVAQYTTHNKDKNDWNVPTQTFDKKGVNINVGNGAVTYYPAAGVRTNTYTFKQEVNFGFLHGINEYGGYWSSSVYNKNPEAGFALEFSYNDIYLFPLSINVNRADALPVRCVQE